MVDKVRISRTGDAVAAAPGAIAISGAATLHLGGAPLARSYYREQIEQIAAHHLLDRDVELGELASFCTDPDDNAPTYQWWRAPKWSGKTALMAAFALNPPPGVRVVAFFVTARWAGHDTRTAFVDIIGDQLAEILAEPSPTTLPSHVRDSYLTGLLNRAAEKCREHGERLVLLVDGLDEDRGTPHDHPGQGTSIAAALPVRLPAGMRVVVSGRPNPGLPGDTAPDHPLHDPAVRRPLAPSSHAKIAEDHMLLELDRLLHAGPEEQDLLGLLTAARGGLTATDLAELTDQPFGLVRRRLRKVAARTFDTRHAYWRRDTEVYMLGHEDLQVIAAEELGEPRLDAYRQRLHTWAEHHRDLGWPPHTPEYLLRGYHRLLSDIGDLPRMIALVTDRARQDRMLDLSGGDTTILTEITTTQDHILRQEPSDLLAMLRLAIHRGHLLLRNAEVPANLPVHWARRGRIDRALALANSMTDPVHTCAAISRVAAALAAMGKSKQAHELIERAETVARNIAKGFDRSHALVHVVAATAAMGELDQAENLALGIPDLYHRTHALTRLARFLVRTGDVERARALADHAENIAQSMITSGNKSSALMGVAHAFVHTGTPGKAEGIAHSFSDSMGAWALKALATTTTEAGFWDLTESIAQRISDPREQADVLASLAEEVARRGDLERAHSLLRRSESIIRAIADLDQQVGALANLAVVIARTGDTNHANLLIDDVQAAVHDITYWQHRMSAMRGAVTAITEIGDLTRAESFARDIIDPTHRTMALSIVAAALARSGHLERAEALTRDFTDVFNRPHPRVHVAEVIADMGDLARAERVARNIVSPRQREWALGSVAVALARAGDTDTAAAVIRHDISPLWRGLPLAELAATCVLAGDVNRAEEIVHDIDDPASRARIFGDIAAAYADDGELEQFYLFTRQAETAIADVMDFTERSQELQRLAELFAEIGDQSRLVTLMERVADNARHLTSDDHALAMVWTVRMHLQNGNLEGADSTAAEIVEPSSRLWVLMDLVDSFFQIGEHERVQQLIDHAKELARNRVEPELRARTLTQIALSLVQVEDLESARSLIDEAETVAKQSYQAWGLEQVAEALVWVGDLQRSLSIACGLDTSEQQDKALAQVATTTAQYGDSKQAKIIAEKITDTDLQSETMLELARLHLSNGNSTDHYESEHPTVQSSDSNTDHLWFLIGESLRRTKWDKCLEILTDLIPEAASVALRELRAIGWAPDRGATNQVTTGRHPTHPSDHSIYP